MVEYRDLVPLVNGDLKNLKTAGRLVLTTPILQQFAVRKLSILGEHNDLGV